MKNCVNEYSACSVDEIVDEIAEKYIEGTPEVGTVMKFMDVLLSSSRAATEKKKILEEEFGVAMNEELEREVLVMCNLICDSVNVGGFWKLCFDPQKGATNKD